MKTGQVMALVLICFVGCSNPDTPGGSPVPPAETAKKPAAVKTDALLEQAKAAFDAGDYDTSFQAWSQAAEAGSAKAAFSVGRSYEYGQGIESDLQQAFEWYRRAADMGSADGMYQVAEFYVEGKGVAHSQSEAFVWMKKAADLKQPDALYMLGVMFVMGQGTEIEREKGMDLVAEAAELGQPNAMKTMELYQMLPIAVDEQQAAPPSADEKSPG